MISKKALEEFKKIYKEEFGEKITDREAVSLGTNLLTMFSAVHRPIKKEWLKESKKVKKFRVISAML